MGLQIYGNIDAGSLLTGKVQSANDLVSTGIKNLVAGDGLEVELFLTSQTGFVNIQDYSVRLGIGDLNARPTGGTFDLGSTTGLAYNLSASDLQTAIASESAANTTTLLSPFVFKTVFTANGSQTIPSIDSTGLTPSSTVSITKLVTGDGSTQEQWLTRIFANPLSFQDTWTNFTKTGVGEGLSGILGLGTPEIYSQFSESVTSFTSTLEMEITDTDGNANTVFQIPVTIGGESIGAGITVSSITPSNFVTATDVNTTVDSVTTRANTLYVSADRGSDATGTRNSFTKPYETFAGAKADLQSGDTIHLIDGSFVSEGTQTFTSGGVIIHIEDGVECPNIKYTGLGNLSIYGIGTQQSVGGNTGISVETTSTGNVFLNNLYLTGGFKNAGGEVTARNCTFAKKVEFTTGSSSLRKEFTECTFQTNSAGTEAILYTEAGIVTFFDNCVISNYLYAGHSVIFTNTTTAPTYTSFRNCLILTSSGYNAFHKTSTNTSVSLDFIGGSTSMTYFSNPSDFTIGGNYACQTSLNSLAYSI